MLDSLFNRSESLVAIDIGASAVKLVEIDNSGDKPVLLNIGIAPLAKSAVSNTMVKEPMEVSAKIASLIESNGIVDKRVVSAIPSPSVFTKQIRLQKMSEKELRENLQFEAANYIPHNIADVKMDYFVMGADGTSHMKVLLVAAKNEIVDTYVQSVALAGLEAAIIDVDSYALQSIVEALYPHYSDKTVAVVDVGARFSTVSIFREGRSLFTGDIGVGGHSISEDISAQLDVTFTEAEKLKISRGSGSDHESTVLEILDQSVEHFTSEIQRQLTFFWNAVEADGVIDLILVTGGGGLIARFC